MAKYIIKTMFKYRLKKCIIFNNKKLLQFIAKKNNFYDFVKQQLNKYRKTQIQYFSKEQKKSIDNVYNYKTLKNLSNHNKMDIDDLFKIFVISHASIPIKEWRYHLLGFIKEIKKIKYLNSEITNKAIEYINKWDTIFDNNDFKSLCIQNSISNKLRKGEAHSSDFFIFLNWCSIIYPDKDLWDIPLYIQIISQLVKLKDIIVTVYPGIFLYDKAYDRLVLYYEKILSSRKGYTSDTKIKTKKILKGI